MLGFSEAHSQKPTASNRELLFRAGANISLLLAIHSPTETKRTYSRQTEAKIDKKRLMCIIIN